MHTTFYWAWYVNTYTSAIVIPQDSLHLIYTEHFLSYFLQPFLFFIKLNCSFGKNFNCNELAWLPFLYYPLLFSFGMHIWVSKLMQKIICVGILFKIKACSIFELSTSRTWRCTKIIEMISEKIPLCKWHVWTSCSPIFRWCWCGLKFILKSILKFILTFNHLRFHDIFMKTVI